MRKLKHIAAAIATLAAMTGWAQQLTYTNGVIFINEDYYGDKGGSLNFYNYDYNEMEYNVFAMANPGVNLGVTTQHGQMFGDRLFLVSKQANYNEASGSTVGSRLAVLDASTLVQQAAILRFGASADSIYDGRSYCAVSNDKGYVATSAGIFVFDAANLMVKGLIDGTQSSAKGDYDSLYKLQCGDMVRFAGHVFAVQQGVGLHVIDMEADTLVTTLDFPHIVTVFVTAGGHLYVANNSREIYDYGSGPYTADFTQVDPVTFETLAVHGLDDTRGAMSSWGAWRACMVCPDPMSEVVYYNHEEFQNYISCYNFDTREFTDTLILLPEGVDVNWDGSQERQGLYSSAISFDLHTGDMVVQTIEAAPMYAYQNFNRNWVLFYDAQSHELKKEVRLQDAYWFPAMAVYPDWYAPTVSLSDITLAAGEEVVVDLLDVVADADNMAALAACTVAGADEAVAHVWISGLELHISGIAAGQTTADFVADSNGKTATATFTVTVTAGVLTGDVNEDGEVDINDVTALIDLLLKGTEPSAGADVNRDGEVDINDVTALIDLLLKGTN